MLRFSSQEQAEAENKINILKTALYHIKNELSASIIISQREQNLIQHLGRLYEDLYSERAHEIGLGDPNVLLKATDAILGLHNSLQALFIDEGELRRLNQQVAVLKKDLENFLSEIKSYVLLKETLVKKLREVAEIIRDMYSEHVLLEAKKKILLNCEEQFAIIDSPLNEALAKKDPKINSALVNKILAQINKLENEVKELLREERVVDALEKRNVKRDKTLLDFLYKSY